MHNKFKRIYIEITNVCNLNCSFCQETKRPAHYLTLQEFSHICDEVSKYTSFIYLHVKGEPLLHPQLDEILRIAKEHRLTVNITTNGTLLNKSLPILLANPVHQINMSFHSAADNAVIDFDEYVIKLFDTIRTIHDNTKTEMSLRLWTSSDKPEMFGINNVKVLDRLHINIATPFEWPDINNSYFNECGTCQGLRTHIAILCDGSVVPCCLDGNGVMTLGNIFKDSLETILNSERARNFSFDFSSKRYAREALCKHCSFKERFNK